MDEPKSTRMQRTGDGSATLFNTGNFPIIEGSCTIYKGTSAQTETTHYSLDKDTGDIIFTSAPANTYVTKAQFKYAHWRDQHWMEAINRGIEALNGRGFFKQIAKNRTLMALSADVKEYSCPSGCVDLYEVLQSDDYTTSGNFVRPTVNWSYQQDANKLVLGTWPTRANPLEVSFLKNMQTYSATSATLDVLNDWIDLVKIKAGASFYRSLAGKTAKQANANIDEGHFSFTNLRTMANDLDMEFERLAVRKKPTRPGKLINNYVHGGGTA